MDMKIIKQESDYLEIELVGEDHSFVNAIRELLIEDKNVSFAAYNISHPQVGHPHLMVRMKSGTPLAALKDALRRLKKYTEDFKDELKSAKKPSEGRKKK